VTFLVEFGARIVNLACGFALGSMAKACLRMSVALASLLKRRKLVFCATPRLNRTSDSLRGVGGRSRVPRVSNVSTPPGRDDGGNEPFVHGLFHCFIVVVCYTAMVQWDAAPRGLAFYVVEFGARIVNLACGFALGSMAKTCRRMSVALAS
jgi:hypothetical protein